MVQNQFVCIFLSFFNHDYKPFWFPGSLETQYQLVLVGVVGRLGEWVGVGEGVGDGREGWGRWVGGWVY